VARAIDEPGTNRPSEPLADTAEEKATSSGRAPVADRTEEPT
jgi:hypothetical protein